MNCSKIQLDKVESLELYECQSLEINGDDVLESIVGSGHPNIEDASQENDCNSVFNIKSNQTSAVELKLDNSQVIETHRSKPINISSGLSSLVNFFNNDSRSIPMIALQNDSPTIKSKTEGTNHSSFSASENENGHGRTVENFGLDDNKYNFI